MKIEGALCRIGVADCLRFDTFGSDTLAGHRGLALADMVGPTLALPSVTVLTSALRYPPSAC